MTDLPLRRNREFVALWVGQATSALGTSMSTLAYPLLVLTVTGSPGQAGLVASVLAATTFLLRIPAGVVADRVDRRRLMLACDAGRVVAVGSVGVAAFTDHILLAHIVLVAVVEGALGTLFGPAEAVAVRRVVAPGQIQDAVAQNEIRRQVAGLVGPTVGGALFGLGRAWPFVADAASYLVSLLAVSTIRTPLRDGPRRTRTAFRAELMEGLRWLWNQRFLRVLSLWLAFAGVLFTSMGLVTLVLARDLGASPAELGVAFTITGVGGLLGALAAPWILRTVAPGALVISYAWTAAAATFAMLVAGSVWAIGVIGAAAFFLVPAVNALVIAQVALRVPDALHGRVISATIQFTSLLHPVGPAVAGLLLETIGVRRSITCYGLAFVGLALVAMAVRTLRQGPGPLGLPASDH